MHVNIIPIVNFEINTMGLFKVNINQLPLPADFLNYHQIIISIPPLGFGGNHKHPRREIFLCLNEEVEFHWIDENGTKRKTKMKQENQIYLFDVSPFVPHGIKNLSSNSAAVLLEFANVNQYKVEPYPVLDHL